MDPDVEAMASSSSAPSGYNWPARKLTVMTKLYQGDSCWREAEHKQSPERVRKHQAAVKHWALGLAEKAAEIQKSARDLPARLGEAQANGKLALVIGAGVSMSCGFPSWDSLVRRTIDEVLAGKGFQPHEVQAIVSALILGDDLLAASQMLTTLVDEPTLMSVLARNFYAGAGAPSNLLRSTAQMVARCFTINRKKQVPSIVLTFNYDTLIEDELERHGVPVVAWPKNSSVSAMSADCVNVVHWHGILSSKEPYGNGVVFTEASYGEAYLREPSVNPLSEMLHAGLLPFFVGFSFRDPFVRRVLQQQYVDAGAPVAVGLLATEAVVRPAILEPLREATSFASGYDASEIIGVERAKVDPVRERSQATIDLASQLARWILFSIGIEWYQVVKHEDLSGALDAITAGSASDAGITRAPRKKRFSKR